MTATALPEATLSIDAGQSGIKVRLTREGKPRIESVYGGIRTDQALIPQLASIVCHIADDLGETIDVVAAGVSGLTSREADADQLLALVTEHGARRVILAHDSVTSFLGTLGNQHGAVIAAGTGVVTLGVGPDRVVRVDGWGNMMGDAGSGYWIGREGLDAAMRAYDGRGASTPLLDALRSRWPDPEEAYVQLQADPARIEVVASFSRDVAELAPGDSVARAICLHAARELARSVITALRRISGPDTDAEQDRPAVSAIGGVFQSLIIRGRFENLLIDAMPDMRIEPPHGVGIDGVAAMPDLPLTHPLHAHMTAAAR